MPRTRIDRALREACIEHGLRETRIDRTSCAT
jgi:hypothetical protein